MKRPSRDALIRFTRAESSPSESRDVVGWLLEAGAFEAPLRQPAPDPRGYDRALVEGRAFFAGLIRAEGSPVTRREERVVEVVAMSAAALRQAREELVAEPELCSWTVCQQLLDAVATAVLDDPERGEALAMIAVAVVEKLLSDQEGDVTGIDLHALAFANLANARRVKGDLAAAESTFDQAFERLAGGTSDPLIEARILAFLVSQRRDQRRLEEALRVARRGERLARRVGDLELQLRLRLKRATVFWNLGAHDSAIAALDGVSALVTATTDPRIVATARQNLISYLITAGRLDEAEKVLDEVRQVAEGTFGPLDQARIIWLEGRVAAHQGSLDRAERLYSAAQDAFLEHNIGYDAALINLELAEVFLERGELAKVKQLAAAMVPVFAARDVHREAQVALRIFCEAARAEQAGKAMVAEVRDYLERSRRDPSLRFEPSA